MKIMGYWYLIASAVGVMLVIISRRASKRSVFAGRMPAPLEELYSPVKDQVSFEVFRDVWTSIGKAYSVDPRLLRPDDGFSTFDRMDSWILGKAEDNLAEWLHQRGLAAPPRAHLEFAKWVQSSIATS